MNTFSKKSLHVALAGLSTLGLAGAAEAVMANPNGLGQVLVYPYYTVRNGYNVGGVSAAPFNTLSVDRQHDGVDQGGQGSFPRRQGVGRSPRLQRLPVAVRHVDGCG